MTETRGSQRWLVRGTPRPGLPKLYVFPHGGGSPAEYVRMLRDLPGAELHVVQLPGRGTRVQEAPFTRMSDLVPALTDEIPFGDAPFAFFGHCFGTLVAYEVTRELRRTGRRLPERLVLSGYPAAHIPRTEPSMLGFGDDELIAEVGRRFGWEPEGVIDDPHVRELAAASLRADFEVLETYRWQEEPPLPMPVTVLGGRADRVTKEELDAWREHTTRDVTVRMLPGGHFYFREPRSALPRFLTAAVRGLGQTDATRAA